MKFEFDSKGYVLEFERHKMEVEVYKQGTRSKQPSKYPYTTARLIQLVPQAGPAGRKIIAQATVGCMPTDQFSTAKGRLSALRALSRVLKVLREPKELITLMWEAYGKRKEQPVKVIDGVVIPSQQKALPPAPETVH